MERYQRVYKPRPGAPIKENEVRITSQGLMRNYISYAITLLQEKRVSEIVLKAMGRAINKAVMLAEIIKKKMEGLHQNISIGSLDIKDVWEPLEEGLVPVETTRHVSMIAITLSKKALDASSSGYQPPSSEKPLHYPNNSDSNNDGGAVTGPAQGSGRGQGRGRGMAGHGGAYYNNYGEETFNRGRGQGRGRGRGYGGGGRGYNTGYNGGYGGYGGDGEMGYGRGYGRGGWGGDAGRGGGRQRGRGGRGRGR